MPVAAVIRGGKPRVNAGSAMTICGRICGWKMIFLMWFCSSVMTEARPTSEPVPAVVGTAMMGAMPEGSARVQLSPTSSKSQIGNVWPLMKAIALPASRPLPPPKATTPS